MYYTITNDCSSEQNASQELKEQFISTEYPSFDEGYFEWINLLESVTKAKNKYTIIELGAGYGPHLVNAACAIRLYHGNGFAYKLIGVEAEPTCFKWMQQHLRDNAIDPNQHQLIEAAIIDKEGEVRFQVGFPRGFGGFIVSPARYISDPARWFYRRVRWFYRGVGRVYNKIIGQKTKAADSWRVEKEIEKMRPQKVKTVSLNMLLQGLDMVDLIHLDIHGAEFVVLKSAREQMDNKVKRVHIGTHNSKVEKRLRRLFHHLGWECLYDYPGGGRRPTPYGIIEFADGVQTWVNPKLL